MFTVRPNFESFYRLQAAIFHRPLAVWRPLSDIRQPHSQLQLRTVYFYSYFMVGIVLYQICCLLQIAHQRHNLTEMIRVFFIFATALASTCKLIVLRRREESFRQWIAMIQQPMFWPRNADELQLYEQAVRFHLLARNGYLAMTILAFFSVIFKPFIYQVEYHELPIALYEFLSKDDTTNYVLMYVYQVLSTAILAFTNVGFDSLVASLCIHLKGQLDIICRRLEYLHEEGERSGSPHSDSIHDRLLNAVHYYDGIVQLGRIIEDLLMVPVTVQVSCSMLVFIANLLLLSMDIENIYSIGVYQICMLSQIYIMCFFPNEVTLQSQHVSYSLFRAHWFNWGRLERKMTQMMLVRFDLPIQFHSLNPRFIFNLQAFGWICHNSYSFFALLRQVNK